MYNLPTMDDPPGRLLVQGMRAKEAVQNNQPVPFAHGEWNTPVLLPLGIGMRLHKLRFGLYGGTLGIPAMGAPRITECYAALSTQQGLADPPDMDWPETIACWGIGGSSFMSPNVNLNFGDMQTPPNRFIAPGLTSYENTGVLMATENEWWGECTWDFGDRGVLIVAPTLSIYTKGGNRGGPVMATAKLNYSLVQMSPDVASAFNYQRRQYPAFNYNAPAP